MKSVFALFVLFCSTCAMAQFTIKDVADSSGSFVFPVLQSQQQAEIVKKINQTLQKSELGMVITATTKNPLAPLMNEDEYGYTIRCNNARVFSLEITTGHNGAGSHYQFRNYSFDARTGNAVNQNVLFYPSAQVGVRQALYKAWKESIKVNLKDTNFGEEYNTCLAEASKISELPISRMTLTEKTVDLWGGSCLDGSSWRADATLGPHPIAYEQLLAMLTPYGLSLFAGVPASAVAVQQVLIKGKIDGKYAVTLTFAPSDVPDELKGIIVYDKFNIPIPLTGTLTDDKVLFHEMDASNAPVSDIVCTWDGKNLNGTFKGLKSGKVMSFVAAKM